MGYSDKTWYVGSSGPKYYPYVMLLLMGILSTSFAYSDLLITKKCKYQEFCMGCNDETWYVGTSGIKYYPCVLLYISYDWLITTNANIQSSVWATVTTHGMLVVVGTNITHLVFCQQICIFNISFAHLFCLANNKKKGQISRVLYGVQ